MSQRIVLWLVTILICSLWTANLFKRLGRPRRILLDTDIDTDDIFALLYLLKLDRSEFDLQAVTISANAWSDAGHAANQIYDILYMMGRDDVSVGVGGEGGILDDGTILPDVGGYLPIIEQGNTTGGGCRYRQAIPVGTGGRLDTDANFGIRKEFLPQGSRKYTPLLQPTVQQVLIDKVSAGPITILMTGSHTNIAIFLMNNPHLKKNIEHIYVMGGSVRSQNPTSFRGRGNLFTCYSSNPYAEFNMFADPFSAYQVIHSGIPITLVPLDATNTIPITENFFKAFEKNQYTYEAQYCYRSLKIIHDTWNESQFYTNYFMWDSFLAGVAASSMSISHKSNQENEFAEMEYMNITVVTSNEPYGINDGSNPFFDGHKVPRFHLQRGGIHSGHVQTGLNDPFCKNGERKCMEGSTREVFGSGGVRVLVATKAKPNSNATSELSSAFFMNFLDVLNRPEQSGKFNFSTQFQYYKEVYYKPDLTEKKLGKPVIFDIDMSAGDFLALFYLLKVPVEVIDLKAIIVSPTGWANAATIDIVYDILHMMGRDDIPVGLGEMFAMNQSHALGAGDCKYVKAIPHGSGGFLDSDTLYGLARYLPRSPRRYTAENSMKYGAPRDTDHPELRQPLALEVWESTVGTLKQGSKVTILTNGPLTSLAKIVQSASNASSIIEEVYVVGGHISQSERDRGNVFSVDANDHAEMNMFLDPLSAKTVFESTIDITLVPLGVQRKVGSFSTMISKLTDGKEKTPEALFSRRLLSTLYELQQTNYRYKHLDTFLGEVLGAVLLASDHSTLKPYKQIKPIKVVAEGDESQDGETVVDDKQGKSITILEDIDPSVYYDLFATQLNVKDQSAVVGSFEEQTRAWSAPNWTET